MGNEKEGAAKAALVDFLYRDTQIIGSFYAQIFSGNLLSVQRTHSIADEHAATIEGGIKFLQYTDQTNKTNTDITSANIDPHDQKIIDLFSQLSIPVLTTPLEECSNGQIVLIKGKLKIRNIAVIKDSLPLLKSIGMLPDIPLDTQLITQSHGYKNKKISLTNLLEGLFNMLPEGIEAEIETNNGERLVAPLKENNLAYSSHDLLRVYGPTLPGNWTVVGIIDKLNKNNITPESQPNTIREISDMMLESIADMMNQTDYDFAIVPIIIYRNLSY